MEGILFAFFVWVESWRWGGGGGFKDEEGWHSSSVSETLEPWFFFMWHLLELECSRTNSLVVWLHLGCDDNKS